MSFAYSDKDFEQLIECFVQAAKQMDQDGWWWDSSTLTNKSIKRHFLTDMLATKFPILATLAVLTKLLPQPLNTSDGSEPAMPEPKLAADKQNTMQKAGWACW